MTKTKIKRKDVKSKKNGRPSLAEDKKTERINVMASKAHRAIIEAKAKAQNVSVSTFLLDVGLSRKIIPPPPAVNLETLLEINRLGRNLNTLIVLLQKQRNFNLQAIEITVENLQTKISEVGAQLIGKSFYDEAENESAVLDQMESSNGEIISQNTTEISRAVM